jgi:hypothetical protein
VTTEQHIHKLEKDVNDIKGSLDQLIALVREMNKGLYGDEKNDHVGVIEKQRSMQKDIDRLYKEILIITQKNEEQDTLLHAKKSVRGEFITWGQRIIGWIFQGIVIYLIMKGFIGADALIK